MASGGKVLGQDGEDLDTKPFSENTKSLRHRNSVNDWLESPFVTVHKNTS